MARVFVDPHMFSVEWFQSILDELIGSKKVKFLFANCEKGLGELERVRQALAFKKRMQAARKAAEPVAEELEFHLAALRAHQQFARCSHCDDPHIMAAIYLIPTPYVFSEDRRLAKCRDKMRGAINRRYCAFAVIPTEQVYEAVRARIV